MKDWMPGDKLVCVDNQPKAPGKKLCCDLVVGKTYILTDMAPGRDEPNELFVDVEGFSSVAFGYKGGLCFFARRFRKLNKLDKPEGSKEDWKLLLKNNTKAPEPLRLPAPEKVPVPVPAFPMPTWPAPFSRKSA